jgi:uncharacterized protein (DUF58 family)
VLTEAFLRQLRTLALSSRKRRIGTTTGERRSMKRGRSVEFADYRNYTPGDDPRRVDWNIYARLERPYIKLFEDEEDLAVHLLLDESPSMLWRAEGSSHAAKFERACDLVLALGYTALASGDKVTVHTSAGNQLGPKRGVTSFAEMASFVETRRTTNNDERRTTKFERRWSLNGWLKAYAQKARKGLCILISDLFDEQGYLDGLNALGAAGLEFNMLHTLSPDELDPSFVGDLRLKDIETDSKQDLSMDDIVLSQYKQRLSEWTSEIAANCRKRDGRYHLVDSSLPIEQIVLSDLRRGGWLF